jgi:BirA family transcriptional regulator, biotin operon repressor / biotin---[acetyl-CoA-carboxylase] ligase
LRPSVPPAQRGWLPLLAGVALVEAVGRLAVLETALKWPNDLLVSTGEDAFGKCAGVLAEAVNGGAVVLGMGLNVAQRRDELPDPADPAAIEPTSLALAGAVMTDRDPLVRAILRTLARWYERWTDVGGDPTACGLDDAYRTACHTIGRTVTVALPGQPLLRGEACDVDADGRLVVVTEDGTHALAAGDVQHVRTVL